MSLMVLGSDVLSGDHARKPFPLQSHCLTVAQGAEVCLSELRRCEEFGSQTETRPGDAGAAKS